MKEDSLITEKRFRDAFIVTRSDRFRLTSVLSNKSEVTWDSGKYCPKMYGWTTFYEIGDDGHGGKCMIEKYRAKTYKELCNYLKEIGEEWRVENND